MALSNKYNEWLGRRGIGADKGHQGLSRDLTRAVKEQRKQGREALGRRVRGLGGIDS